MANITLTGGNANALRKLVYEDSVSLYNLMAKLLAMGNDAPDESGPGGYYSIATAQRRTSWAIEADGNLGLHPLLIASASDVVAACDFVDAPPAGGPREVGVTTAINRALKPLVMLDAARVAVGHRSTA
jgi:hypothetical protein